MKSIEKVVVDQMIEEEERKIIRGILIEIIKEMINIKSKEKDHIHHQVRVQVHHRHQVALHQTMKATSQVILNRNSMRLTMLTKKKLINSE